MGSSGRTGGGGIEGVYTPGFCPWYGPRWLTTVIQSHKPAVLYHNDPHFDPLTVIYGVLPTSGNLYYAQQRPEIIDAITGQALEPTEAMPYMGGVLYLSAVAYVREPPEPNEPMSWSKRMWGEIVAYHNHTLPSVEVGGVKYAYRMHPDISGVAGGARQYRLPGWATTGAARGVSQVNTRASALSCWCEVNQGLGVPCPNVGFGVNKAAEYEWDQWLMHNAYWESKGVNGVKLGNYCTVTSIVSSLPCTMYSDYWEAKLCVPEFYEDAPARLLAFGAYADGGALVSIIGNSYGKAVSGTHKYVQGGRNKGDPWIITLACPIMPEAYDTTYMAVNKIGR